MQRERIDKAIHAMLDRRESLLRDVERSGGVDGWPHLFSHGHHYATVKSAVGDGLLRQDRHQYSLTRAGKEYLRDLELAKLRQQ